MYRTVPIAIATFFLTQPALDARADVHVSDEVLQPITEFTGPSLEFDFPGLLVGVAEYAEGPTGTTAFYFPDGVTGIVDVRVLTTRLHEMLNERHWRRAFLRHVRALRLVSSMR